MADLVVLASGSGTNFQAIAEYLAPTKHTVTALICDRPGARVLSRAEHLRIRPIVIPYRGARTRAEEELERTLVELSPDLIALAGFMRVLPARIVDRFPDRILNVHPSLLPAWPGLNAIERSFAEPDAAMGVTVHVVDHGVDTGPIIGQFEALRSAHDDLRTMEERIHTLEHAHYPRIIRERLDAIELDRRREGQT